MRIGTIVVVTDNDINDQTLFCIALGMLIIAIDDHLVFFVFSIYFHTLPHGWPIILPKP